MRDALFICRTPWVIELLGLGGPLVSGQTESAALWTMSKDGLGRGPMFRFKKNYFNPCLGGLQMTLDICMPRGVQRPVMPLARDPPQSKR